MERTPEHEANDFPIQEEPYVGKYYREALGTVALIHYVIRARARYHRTKRQRSSH